MSGKLTIDGRVVEFAQRETILDAAVRAGVEIPTLCKGDHLKPEGGCRMCVVEVEGRRRLDAACHTPASNGLVVHTATPRLQALRRDLLALMQSEHGPSAFQRAGNGHKFQRLFAEHGRPNHFGSASEAGKTDDSHPYLRFDAGVCVNCRLCLNVCEQVQGQFVWGTVGRGGNVRMAYGPNERFDDGPCVACGACVDQCPTGALYDLDRAVVGARAAKATDSVCGYCGVGCRVRIESADNRVLRIAGVPEASVNRGHLCVKGRYAHAHHHSPDRLTQPLLQENGGWKRISWDEAIAWATTRLAEIHAKHGPRALGAMTSSRSTNEAAYLLQKLFRTRFATNNVDCCARVCHSSTALALGIATGTGAASTSYDDIERARLIVVAGANPTEAHPVIGARIKQAALRGTPLIVIDPRRIELAEYAHLHLALRAGTNVQLFNGLAKVLIEERLFDSEYITQRCYGLDELRGRLERLSLDDVERVTGVSARLVREAARRMGAARPCLFVSGLGLSELTQGTESVMTFCNLGLLTGSLGKPGAGMMPLRGQNNVQGNADMGGMPDRVTGYQKLDDPAVLERLERLWGKRPPSWPGRTIPEMLDAAAAGEIKALYIQGEDPAQSDPNQSHVIQAFQRVELLIAHELFLSETAKLAHLVLPAAGVFEQEGTFTNAERRIQLVQPAVDPPGEARPDWRIIRDVAIALGEQWSYSGPAEIMDEIAKAAPSLFGGVSFDRLAGDGIQWPCPDRNHPGTQTVHGERFVSGKGRLTSVDYRPSPEKVSGEFPYLLMTGRVLEHYNVGTMTRRTPNRDLAEFDALEINPTDARRERVRDGQRIRVRSRWGEAQAIARLTDRVAAGSLFLTFHFPETHANLVTSAYNDPQSKCPEYKVTAAAIAAM